jgi:hypothetical protein
VTITNEEAKLLKETYPNINDDTLRLNIEPDLLAKTGVAFTSSFDPKTNKYHVSAAADRIYNGILYDSKKEMNYYVEVLEPLLKAGELDYVLYHVRFPVGNDPVTIYEADYVTLKFHISLPGWRIEVIEVKGMHTVSGDRKIKLFRIKYPKLKFTLIS